MLKNKNYDKLVKGCIQLLFNTEKKTEIVKTKSKNV